MTKTRREILKAIEALSEPCTIAEACNIVYETPSGYNLLLTIEKTGAYIEYLYEHALIEIVNAEEVNDGLPAKYRVLGDVLSQLEENVYKETSRRGNM